MYTAGHIMKHKQFAGYIRSSASSATRNKKDPPTYIFLFLFLAPWDKSRWISSLLYNNSSKQESQIYPKREEELDLYTISFDIYLCCCCCAYNRATESLVSFVNMSVDTAVQSSSSLELAQLILQKGLYYYREGKQLNGQNSAGTADGSCSSSIENKKVHL